MNKILIIGCGHMGSALLKAWTKKTNNSFSVVDPIQYKKINKNYNNKVKAFFSIEQINNVALFDIIIFAIKPQITNNVLKNLKKYKFKKKVIFVSIVAGKKINSFKNFLPNSNQFIRVMPNMPAIINEGMSCLVTNSNILNKNKNLINNLFLQVGKTLWLKKEQDINKVTAISGSGPGYIFLFVDAFEKAAFELGLSNKDTKELIHQTFLGSINLLLKQKNTALLLANNIAVKGGTTEAGLKIFKNQNMLHKTFKKVIMAAYKRSVELE